ncbi:MAG: hypothetical protein V3V62_14050 [bacterium]
MKIAPYLAQNVSRSYLRQQRIGERIAESRGRSSGEIPPRPAVQIELSQAARQASEDARRQAAEFRDEQLSLVSERFAERLVARGGEEGEGGGEEASGFDRVLESVGLAIQKGADGEGDVIVRKDTGEVLSELAPEALDSVKEVLRQSARRVLDGLI